MRAMRNFIWVLSVLVLAGADFVYAQEKAHFRIRYIINRPEVDSTFVDNATRISDIRSFLEEASADPQLRIIGVRFRGTASPDGGYEFNRWLSENRLRTFKELVGAYMQIPDDLIHANESDIPWDEFRREVAASDLAYRDEMLAVIDEGPRIVPWFNKRHIDARLLKLKKMHGGEVWESLKVPILRDLRYGDAVFEYYRLPSPVRSSPRTALVSLPGRPAILAPTPAWQRPWMPHVYLKTNFIGLGMLMANLAVEADVAPHWSCTLPVYYSGMDWFKSTIKFRNFTVQPELRYWFSLRDDGRFLYNDGLFLGAHLEMCYYNFAFDGPYRFQDYRGRTPALGGGLSVGYRTHISRDRRWKMEFSVGAGIYPLDYSVFHNTPDVRDGQWVERRRSIYFGPDQASVTLSYTFDWSRRAKIYRKGGGR